MQRYFSVATNLGSLRKPMDTRLAISKESDLLWSRSAILRIAGVEVLTGNVSQGLEMLKAKAADLVVLCHTLNEAQIATIAVLARQVNPVVRILRLNAMKAYYSSTEVADATSMAQPELVVSKVRDLLAFPRPSRAQHESDVVHPTGLWTT